METSKNADEFDESQSLHVIREMIKVSHRKLQNDGFLFIVWGLIMSVHYLIFYLVEKLAILHQLRLVFKYLAIALVVGGFIYTLVYILKQRKKVQTYVSTSVRYVWIGMFCSLVLINFIQNNVLPEIIFELQHPIFMVIVAFAIFVTGGIIRYNTLIHGAIFFALMALIASYLPLPDQLLMEALAWLIALVIPGYMLYSSRND